MAQLVGFVDATKPSYVCRLHKALYRLKQAPRVALLGCGFQNSIVDTNLFIHKATHLSNW